jgi:hypothetical protein
MKNEFSEHRAHIPPTPIGPDSVGAASIPNTDGRPLEQSKAGLVLFFGLLSMLACWPLGIVAWIMGNSHLAKMRSGRMSTATKSTVQVGRVLGIIGTLAFAAFIIFIVLALPKEMPKFSDFFGREPLTPDRMVFVGKWTGNQGTTITIRPNGSADYTAKNSNVKGGRVEFKDGSLSIGLFGLSKTWKIEVPPKLRDDGRWIMKLGGETFSKKAEGVTA